MHVNDMVELIIRAGVKVEKMRLSGEAVVTKKTVKLSPAQAVIMAKIQDEGSRTGTVDGWISMTNISTGENFRSISCLKRKGYIDLKRDSAHYLWARIIKGP